MFKSLPLIVALFLSFAHAVGGQNDPLPRRGVFGAQMQPLSPEKQQELKVSGGVQLMAILPGTTAEAGKLQAGDVLIKLGDQAINSPADVGAFVYKTMPGQKFSATILREGKEQIVSLTMVARPKEQGETYEVLYDHVVSHGHRLRTLVTKPKQEGKRPVLFLIQGIGYSSIEAPLTGAGGYSRILKAFNDKGYVTVRVEKPGLGDSEGGPANTVDYERDLDAFRQGLKAVKKYDFVDPDNVFVFGHSMGGCHGPILASEIAV
ncbi:MAG TPA: alpha/beta fold hydrolase, partial [Fimbriimonadaceae bacterium]|nr:alpha/beta fold hydrolase [Fimbriimonadaceae bacterium]